MKVLPAHGRELDSQVWNCERMWSSVTSINTDVKAQNYDSAFKYVILVVNNYLWMVPKRLAISSCIVLQWVARTSRRCRRQRDSPSSLPSARSSSQPSRTNAVSVSPKTQRLTWENRCVLRHCVHTTWRQSIERLWRHCRSSSAAVCVSLTTRCEATSAVRAMTQWRSALETVSTPSWVFPIWNASAGSDVATMARTASRCRAMCEVKFLEDSFLKSAHVINVRIRYVSYQTRFSVG